MAQLEKQPAQFSIVAQLCRSLEETTKRNEKIRLIGEVLRKIRPEDVAYVTLFLAGKPFPEADPRVLEISYSTLSAAGLTMNQTLLTENTHSLTIAEVAFQTGFSDQSHLDRRFKAAFGQVPSAVRKQLNC